MFRNYTWIKEEIMRESLKYLKKNSKSTVYQNLWDAAKAIFRRKFIAFKELYGWTMKDVSFLQSM